MSLVLFSVIAVGATGYALLQGTGADAPSRAATSAIPQHWLEYDPAIADLVSGIDGSEIYRSTHNLQNFSTRVYPSDGNRRAADYLHDRLAAIPGLVVTRPGGSYRNVIASLPGRDPASGAVVIVGAHYDSASSDPHRAPGATDNGCGVAIVLELARVMRTHEFDRTIQFAFWNAEEEGLAGSREYVAEARERSMDIPLYLNYDSSGYDPENEYVLDVMYDDDSEPFAELLREYNSEYAIGFDLTYNEHECGSDHVPFRKGGYPALTTHTERHAPTVHSPQDTIDLVSTDYARRNAQLGTAILARTAGLRG